MLYLGEVHSPVIFHSGRGSTANALRTENGYFPDFGGAKMVVIGDTDQIDNPYVDSRSNGLVYCATA